MTLPMRRMTPRELQELRAQLALRSAISIELSLKLDPREQEACEEALRFVVAARLHAEANESGLVIV